MITEHDVCALPDDHRDWRHLVIKVQRRSGDMWVLQHCGFYYVGEGEWSPSLSDALEFDERYALDLAEQLKVQVEVSGLTAADLLSQESA
jgi:hypothetical protein